jgi:hypothetical protein
MAEIKLERSTFTLASCGIYDLFDVAGHVEPVLCVNCFDVIVGHVILI